MLEEDMIRESTEYIGSI